jgi:hypothetical protein
MAEMDGRLDVGVIIVQDDDAGFFSLNGHRNGVPHLDDVIEDLNSLRSAITVPIWVIALS